MKESFCIKTIADEIREELNNSKSGLRDDEVRKIINDFLLRKKHLDPVDLLTLNQISERIFCALRYDTSILQKYINDPEITEIMVNAADRIYIEKKGQIIETGEAFFDVEELEEVIRRIAGNVHREISEMIPIVDARLEDGSRINAVYKNIALDGPALTIRKFAQNTITLENLIEKETITLEAAQFLLKMMKAGYNFFISGGTSSGKTTFLNALAEKIDLEKRIVLIEDSSEVKISKAHNLVRMECRERGEKRLAIGMDKLIKTSLRMRPDVLIIGEIRDGKALVNMLNGLNTGHSGLCTGHGNSVEGMIRRMENLYLQEAHYPMEAIDSQIAEGINFIIHLAKLGNGCRKVIDISEIYLNDSNRIALNQIYSWDEGKLRPTGNFIRRREKYELYHE